MDKKKKKTNRTVDAYAQPPDKPNLGLQISSKLVK